MHTNNKQNVATVQKSNLDLAGKHLKKSAQFQYSDYHLISKTRAHNRVNNRFILLQFK